MYGGLAQRFGQDGVYSFVFYVDDSVINTDVFISLGLFDWLEEELSAVQASG